MADGDAAAAAAVAVVAAAAAAAVVVVVRQRDPSPSQTSPDLDPDPRTFRNQTGHPALQVVSARPSSWRSRTSRRSSAAGADPALPPSCSSLRPKRDPHQSAAAGLLRCCCQKGRRLHRQIAVGAGLTRCCQRGHRLLPSGVGAGLSSSSLYCRRGCRHRRHHQWRRRRSAAGFAASHHCHRRDPRRQSPDSARPLQCCRQRGRRRLAEFQCCFLRRDPCLCSGLVLYLAGCQITKVACLVCPCPCPSQYSSMMSSDHRKALHSGQAVVGSRSNSQRCLHLHQTLTFQLNMRDFYCNCFRQEDVSCAGSCYLVKFQL